MIKTPDKGAIHGLEHFVKEGKQIGVGGGRWVPHYIRLVKRALLVDGTEAARIAVASHVQEPFEVFGSNLSVREGNLEKGNQI